MRITRTLTAAFAALAISGSAALAWGDMYMGDATNDPNSNFLMHSYPTKNNYCPAGLQPVTIGGEICCGVPNAGPYINRAGKVRKVIHKPKPKPVHRGPVAVEGVKGVVFR